MATSAALSAAIAVFCAFAFFGVIRNSVTVDEYVHVPVGVAYWRSGDFRLDHAGNPPALRLLYSAPVLAFRPELTFAPFVKNNEFYKTGYRFMIENYPRYHRLFVPARLVATGLGAGLILVLFLAARREWGTSAGLFAAAVAALNPNLLAFGSIVSLDVGLALFTTAAWLTLPDALRSKRTAPAAVCGLLLGLALAAKFTALVNLPLMAAAAIAWTAPRGKRRGAIAMTAGRMALIFLIAWAVLNGSYLFHGTFSPLRSIPFRSEIFQRIATFPPPGFPALAPSDYLLGLDAHKSALGRVFDYYLMGKTSSEGWPHYFLVAWLVKEPLPVIALGSFGMLAVFSSKKASFADAARSIVTIGTFLFFSLALKVDLGVRYLLPILPFVWMYAGYGFDRLAKTRFGRYAAPAALLWMALELVPLDGNYLSYFNAAAGGPAGGHRYLLESNLDWGQNTIRLKEELDRMGVEKARIAQYGLVDPGVYGIRHDWLPCEPTPGVMAVSRNILAGLDPFQRKTPRCYDWLRERTPDKELGGAILIYRVGEQSAP